MVPGGTLAGGGVTVSGTDIGTIVVPLGEPINLTATPLANFFIGGWFVDNGQLLDNINGLIANGDLHIEVLFLENEEEISNNNSPGEGNINEESSQNEEESGNATIGTGDNTRILIYLILMITAIGGVILSLRSKKGKRYN
ncbi:MAG: hypothetical protein FWC79_01720 [Oscillospiraceae bacterium]|nr:hypothetical protein [Oscillospiraceae bacterium]